MTRGLEWLRADWPAPARVHCLTTLRGRDDGTGPFAGFNLGAHVGDDAERVRRHRETLREALDGRPALRWLRQVHGTTVAEAAHGDAGIATADALYTSEAGLACGILTADCLPVSLCSADGEEIAAAHAGWRGLAGGVLENTLARFRAAPARILAWLGPAIGPCHFEVGEEVRAAFLAASEPASRLAVEAAFRPAGADKWLADLYALARVRLRAAGVGAIHGGGFCTVCDPAQRFYSYRREAVTGRFATLIWRS